jgi:hypothetical protein
LVPDNHGAGKRSVDKANVQKQLYTICYPALRVITTRRLTTTIIIPTGALATAAIATAAALK